MSETTPDNQIQDPAPHRQVSLAGSDDRPVNEATLVDTGPNAAEAPPSGELSSRDPPSGLRKWRPTSDFPQDPSALGRQILETHYREMRASHEFLVRSRAQLKRRSRETRNSRQDLLDTVRRYEEQYAVAGRERVEQFELARELKQKLEAFERDQQTLDQLVNEFETSSEATGFWDILKITQFLQRIRQLLRGRGARP